MDGYLVGGAGVVEFWDGGMVSWCRLVGKG